MNNIFIYTGEKGVGKSTHLSQTFLHRENACGILQPRLEGIKFLVDIKSKEKRKLELDKPAADEKVITIGNYLFSKETFQWGQQKLSEAVATEGKLLIIDEIGPLELDGSGLEPILSGVISKGISLEKILLLVVRPKLVEEVKEKYGLLKPVVINYGEMIPI